MDTDRELKIRKCDQSRALIHRVYYYLKAEYEFTLSLQKCGCDLSHLRDITQRTADAVGVDISTVRHVLDTEPVGIVKPKYNINFLAKQPKKKKQGDVQVEKNETEFAEVPIVNVDYDDFIEIDYGEPDVKKVKTEPGVDDIKENDLGNFEGNIKQEVDVKEEIDTEDDAEEGEQGLYDSITVKEECIM